MTKELERLSTATMNAAILSGAIGFVNMHIDCYSNGLKINGLCDTMYILERFAEEVADELIDIEMDLIKVAKGIDK